MRTLTISSFLLGLTLAIATKVEAVPLDFTFNGTVSAVSVSSGADVSPLVSVGDAVSGSLHWWHPGEGPVGSFSDATGSYSLPSGVVSGPFWLWSVSQGEVDATIGLQGGQGPATLVDGYSYSFHNLVFSLPLEAAGADWRDYVDLTTADFGRFELFGDGWSDGNRSIVVAEVDLNHASFTSPWSHVPDTGAGILLLGLAVAASVCFRRLSSE